MQDPAPNPPQQPVTPPPPGVEAAATATAQFPGGAVLLQPAPTSVREVTGLRERREILRDQLTRAVNRRESLVGEMNETGNPDARAGLQQRLNLLDERILQLERDQATTEQLLANAAPEVLALAAERPVQTSGADDEAMAAMFFFALTLGILLTWIAGRWRRRRARKRGGVAATPLPDDARFERLSQAVDAIAEEVERIGEGQRFVTQLLAQRRESPGLAGITERRESSG